MSDTTHEVEVQFTAKDLTSSVINRINKSAGVLSRKVDGITTKVAGFARTFGGLGAVFGFGASIAGANKYLATIEDLSTVTGESANKMASITHAMEQSGLAGEEVRMIMLGISKKQAEIQGGSKELVKLTKRYGVEMSKGPEAALISMAKSVEKGKIGTGEVVKLLEESGSKAMDLLRKGPAEVRRLLAEGAEKNKHINATSIAQYKAMDVQMKRVKQAWTRITTTIMIKLAPALTKLMAYVERNIDGWTDSATRFGEFMATHMDGIITAAKTFGKIMTANYVLMKLTGDGMLANLGKMGKWAKGPKAAGAAGGADATDAIMAAQMMPGRKKGGKISGRKGVMAKRQKGVGKVMGKMLGRFPKMGLRLLLVFKRIGTIGGKVGKFFKKTGKVSAKVGGIFLRVGKAVMPLLKVAKMAAKFTVISLVVTAVVAGIKKIMDNVGGIRDRLGALLGKTWENIKGIAETIGGLFSKDSAMGKFFSFIGDAFVTVLEGVLWLIEKITAGIRIAAVMASEGFVHIDQARNYISGENMTKRNKAYTKAYDLQMKLTEAYKAGTATTAKHVAMYNEMIDLYKESDKRWAKGQTRAAIKDKLGYLKGYGKVAETPEGRPQVHNDFRGSRFDIMQNFAEGFDPDRIAVAFSNDLAALGERRLASGLAPAFSAR